MPRKKRLRTVLVTAEIVTDMTNKELKAGLYFSFDPGPSANRYDLIPQQVHIQEVQAPKKEVVV